MKFKVFQGKVARSFFFHVVSTNGKVTLPSQGYPTAGHAHRAVAQVWKSFVKLIDPTRVLQLPAIPYTKDSLLPVVRKPRNVGAKKALKRSAKRRA